jgi:hypothetical protein
MIFRTFLVRVMLLATVLVLTAATFNVVIDPYSLFEVWREPGFNDAKPMAATRLRTSKPYQLMRARPTTLIAGNSRPELGLDPQSACWRGSDQPVYNAGIPGIGIYQQARVIQSSLLQGHTRRVLWGLDFLDFVSLQQQGPVSWPPPPAVIDGRLPVTADGQVNSGYRLQWLRDVRDATLSLDALTDSVSTLIQADAPYGSTRRGDGFNPARDYIGIVNAEGQGVLFEQKNLEVMQRLAQGPFELYVPGREGSQAFKSVRFILELARRDGVQVDLFINPYHADYLAAVELSGNWRLLEQWKRSLAALAADFEGASLWDFNGFDRYSSQLLTPDMRAGDALAWYWEPAHYRAELGERMIARINDIDCDGRLDREFGALLTPADIDDHLEGLRGQMRVFGTRFAAHWDRLAERYRAVLRLN